MKVLKYGVVYGAALLFGIAIGYIIAYELSFVPPPSPHSNTQLLLPHDWIVMDVEDTGSMEPTLNGCSRVVVTTEPVGIGDIVCARYNGKMIVHRIIDEAGDYWVLRGDANNRSEHVLKKDVVWRVVAIIY